MQHKFAPSLPFQFWAGLNNSKFIRKPGRKLEVNAGNNRKQQETTKKQQQKTTGNNSATQPSFIKQLIKSVH